MCSIETRRERRQRSGFSVACQREGATLPTYEIRAVLRIGAEWTDGRADRVTHARTHKQPSKQTRNQVQGKAQEVQLRACHFV